MVNNKIYRHTCGTKNKAEAKEFAEKMQLVKHATTRDAALQLVDILFPPHEATGILIAGGWEEYLRIANSTGIINVTSRTRQTRHEVYNRFKAWAIEHAPKCPMVHHITGPIAAEFAQYLMTAKNRMGNTLTAKTRRNLIVELSTIWRALEKADARIHNPWTGLAPKVDGYERREAFTREQETAIFAAAEKIGKDWPLACLIGRHTGMRYGDIANLLWSEVDMDGKVIRKTPNKTKSHRITVAIPMVPELHAALLTRNHDSDFVLPLHAKMYEDISGTSYKMLNFREVLTEAGITSEKYTFHSWRHTLRSRMAEAHVDLETAKRLLGHTEDATSRHYDHDEHLTENLAAVMAAR